MFQGFLSRQRGRNLAKGSTQKKLRNLEYTRGAEVLFSIKKNDKLCAGCHINIPTNFRQVKGHAWRMLGFSGFVQTYK
ncbi:hypothetical protein NQ317_008702 [Molorchus minor]|uniref:Uncharacterized protein n=1 Tax=Molorchus minor TaxID=1323400 RepID=A0ABQ9J3N9_9CUCU|nr:hypothetical protein NQ317_008702 [Molorchus minor]